MQFNNNLRQYFVWESSAKVFSAYGAYEILDVVDYLNLSKMINTVFGDCDCEFFNVHINSPHGPNMMLALSERWKESPEDVEKGFGFITENQFLLWDGLIEDL